MKKRCLLFCFMGLVSLTMAQSNPEIIPLPVSMIRENGYSILKNHTTISISNNSPVLKELAANLSKKISLPTGYKISIVSEKSPGYIRLHLLKKQDILLGKEGYSLIVKGSSIDISANTEAGIFYGIQTLLQLFPKEIECSSVQNNSIWKIPNVHITDYPRFSWRGLMFDVSRHFFSKQDVFDFIDNMARYKFNILHLHLTDDEGWRIEIKSLPKLTEKGAWNVKKTGTFGEFTAPTADEPRNYGGFYTQEDLKEIVKYAKEHFIDILPEVDIPGHSLAAIASYPDLSCTPGAENYVVRSGEKIMDWHAGGFTALVDNTLCPANERVYNFLDKVFTEIAGIFPFEYIHIGGDECAKNFWEKSDAVQQLMHKEGLKSMEEVQSYFEKKVEKIVESKGKKVIGWDEILEGGLAPNAAVMSWRGIKGGIEAAKQGHEVVMSPTNFVYLDYMQGDKAIEPPVYATLRLKTVYSFEPVPDGIDAKYIKGGQGNLWTEQIYNTRHLQYMLWPRSLAIAECLWAPRKNKDWNDFSKRVESIFDRMDIEHIKYARSMFDPIINAKKGGNGLVVQLDTEINGLDIYYSFDNSNPDNYYPRYTTALEVPKDAVMLKLITYRGNKIMGRQLNIPIAELAAKAANKN